MQMNRLPQSVIAAIESSRVPSILANIAPEAMSESRQDQVPGGTGRLLDSPMAITSTQYPRSLDPAGRFCPDPIEWPSLISHGPQAFPREIPSGSECEKSILEQPCGEMRCTEIKPSFRIRSN